MLTRPRLACHRRSHPSRRRCAWGAVPLPALFVVLALLLLPTTAVRAQVLDPNAFTSLGTFNSQPGNYLVNTDTNTLTAPDGTVITGVVSGNIVVFTFDAISFNAGSTLFFGSGARAVALLSKGDATFAGQINLSGGGGGGAPWGGPGGYAAGGPGQNGSGPGGGMYDGGAGGFGGAGRNYGGSGGPVYGDLSVKLEGGSGGAGSRGDGGGGGGGALQLGALGTLRITGSVIADGGSGNSVFFGGGGAGGGVLVRGQQVNIAATGSVTARGGDNLFNACGGGGRILIVAGTFTNSGFVSVAGGRSIFVGSGQEGVLTLPNQRPVANAGPDQPVECQGATTSVILDGSKSSDPDGGTLTYQWYEGDQQMAAGATPTVKLSGDGPHTLTLVVRDPDGGSDSDSVTITVTDTTAPVLTLNGSDPMTIEGGSLFTDPGARATDTCDGEVSVSVSGSVNTAVVGTYTLTYTATDRAGNTARTTRTVNVVDTKAPDITLNGANPLTVSQGSAFTDPGARATDTVDGPVAVSVRGTVNTAVLGTYTLTYTATDRAGNTATATRTVRVVDTTAPTVTATANKTTLTPTNGKYVPVTVTGNVTDTGSGVNWSSGSYTVTDSQGAPVSGTFTIKADGTYTFTVSLQASRDDAIKAGRTYTIVVSAKDNAGNTGTASPVTVTVPHNQGK